MEYRDIEFQLRDGVATVILNRPDHLNTFTGKMGEELEHAYRRCDEDDEIRAVVLTGAGRAFCAGADMSEAASSFESQEGNEAFSAAGVAFPAFRIRKLVVAAVNGHAIGIGLTLALQADVRIFAKEAKYGVVQVRRGVMPDAYAHWTLPRLVGMARAAEILLTGKTFRGDEIECLGIASRVLPSAEVLAAAQDMALDVATNAAPLSVAFSKRLLWQSLELSAEDVERQETALHHVLLGGPDALEGPVAFMQKRPPNWKQRISKDWPKTQ
ncbi:MAG: enoyl-CoA hydratase/isomerase family protein [Deltaproteobacteria bacterium]|nr:enoyl-CoA hydratase/isomerase family protein [Deltaproteobacteria bacterium]MBW2397179.1 enoyl-CoA hydratase/isomerase family protein [Deltaproteobacteria bacterium]